MIKKISVFSIILLIFINFSFAQEQNSVHIGIGPGVAVPISRYQKTHSIGVLGYVDANIFAKENLAAGVRYSFNYFIGKDKKLENNTVFYDDDQIHEFLLMCTFFFKGNWRPFLSFGLGTYVAPGYNDLGFVPSFGVMHQFADKWFFTIRGDMAYMRKNDFSYCKVVLGVNLPVFQ